MAFMAFMAFMTIMTFVAFMTFMAYLTSNRCNADNIIQSYKNQSFCLDLVEKGSEIEIQFTREFKAMIFIQECKECQYFMDA